MTVRSAPRMPADEDPPFSAPQEWHAEMARENEDAMTGYEYRGTGRSLSPDEAAKAARNGRAPQPPAAPVLKGAVKVERWPEKSRYPFRQIAGDGGIWKLDPAAYKVSVSGVVQAARKWGEVNGLAAKVMQDDGHVYVQFSKAAGR